MRQRPQFEVESRVSLMEGRREWSLLATGQQIYQFFGRFRMHRTGTVHSLQFISAGAERILFSFTSLLIFPTMIDESTNLIVSQTNAHKTRRTKFHFHKNFHLTGESKEKKIFLITSYSKFGVSVTTNSWMQATVAVIFRWKRKSSRMYKKPIKKENHLTK